MPNWKKLIVSGSDANLNSLDITTELTASDALITNDLDVLGNITASGNVSASGDLYTNNSLFVGNKGAIGTDGNDLTLIANTAEWTGIQIGRFSTNTQNIELYGPVTASGNISASGDFIGTNFTGSSFTGSFVGDGSGLTDTPINITAGTALTFTGDTLNVSTAGANLGSSNVPSSAASRNYVIQHQNNAAQTLVVNVPWTDNNTEYTAGTGLSLSVGNVFSANTAGAVLVGSSIPATVSNRYYAIQTNISDELIVNVPWTDTSWDGIFTGSAQITGSLGVTGSVLVDGNVGIGTTSPDYNLQVESTGNAEIHAQRLSGTGVLFQAQAAAGVIGTTTNHDLDIKTNGSTKIKIENTGNVGIGTTSPSQKLQVVSDSIIMSEFTTTSTKGGIKIAEADDGGFLSTEAGRICLGSAIGVSTNNLTYLMSTNKLGIGTASPTEKLDVIGNIKASGSIQVGVNEGSPTAALVGSIRYKSDANNSFVDMVMQTDVTTYEWVNIVTNTW